MSRPRRHRLVVVGLDAANPDLLRRWAADGSLPNLAALMRRGLSGSTRSVEGFIVGATWGSFATGLNPARHGYHYVAQLRPGTYRYERATLAHECFWSPLSRAGRQVAVIDVPLCPPDPDIKGIHLVDWGGIEPWSRFEASSEAVRKRVLAEWGPHPLHHDGDRLRRTVAEYRELVRVLTGGLAIRGAMSRRLLAERDWDLFLHVFPEGHCAGHNLWHVHDPAHPAHDPAVAAALGDPIRTVYAAADAALGEVLAAAGDATVMVVSAHGMSYWYGAQFVLAEVLFRLGVAARRPAPAPPTGTLAAAARAARAAWHLVPRPLRDRVHAIRAAASARLRQEAPLPVLEADPARSRCFLVRNGHLSAGIRLNLRGREPAGLLAPGAEAEAFIRQLTADLLAIVDERTGQPVIRQVRRTGDLYQGDRLDHLPDLLVDWADEVPTGSSNIAGGAAATVRVRSERIGVVEGTNHFSRTGDHRIEGLLVAAGPGIGPGVMARPVSVLDFAPTIGALLGVPLDGGDGAPIGELLGALQDPGPGGR